MKTKTKKLSKVTKQLLKTIKPVMKRMLPKTIANEILGHISLYGMKEINPTIYESYIQYTLMGDKQLLDNILTIFQYKINIDDNNDTVYFEKL